MDWKFSDRRQPCLLSHSNMEANQEQRYLLFKLILVWYTIWVGGRETPLCVIKQGMMVFIQLFLLQTVEPRLLGTNCTILSWWCTKNLDSPQSLKTDRFSSPELQTAKSPSVCLTIQWGHWDRKHGFLFWHHRRASKQTGGGQEIRWSLSMVHLCPKINKPPRVKHQISFKSYKI